MKKGKKSFKLSTNQILLILASLLLLLFVLFFSYLGQTLNWPFLLLPSFYLLYVYQLNLKKTLLPKMVKTRVIPVIVLSVIGLYVPYISIPFLVLFAVEILLDFKKFAKKKRFAPVLWSEIFLFVPLVALLFHRSHVAGQSNVIVYVLCLLVLSVYAYYRKRMNGKRLVIV